MVEHRIVKQEDQDWARLARDLALKLALASSTSSGFYTRWRIIQSRLERLAQSLHGFSANLASGSCLQLIQSIVETLKSVHNAQASPPAGQGKLQAQSSLDAIVARIDSHIAALATVARGSAVDCDSDLKGLVASLQLHGGVREAALRRLLRRLRHGADGASAAAAIAKLGALPILARIAAASDHLRDDALDALLLTLPFAAPEATFAPLARMVELGTSSDKALLAIRSLVSSSPRAAALAAARPRLVARMCSIAAASTNTSGTQPEVATVPLAAAIAPTPQQEHHHSSAAISCKPSSKKGSLQLLRALQLLRTSQQRHRPERLWPAKLFRGRRPIRSLLTA